VKRVLSLDGGGIRGVIPAKLLEHLESLTGVPCAKQFDLIVGTSTGGILAALLACGFPAKEASALYVSEGSIIFTRSQRDFIFDHFHIVGAKFGAAGIEGVLQNHFGTRTLASATTHLMISSFDLVKNDAHFFKSWEAKGELMWEVARATSAAPTYFPPFHSLIDGAVACNDPAMCAYAEALQLWPGEQTSVVSLGTGSHVDSSVSARFSGDIGWAAKIPGVLLTASMGMVSYQAQRIIAAGHYTRIQPTLGTVCPDLDNASAENIAALISTAQGSFPAIEELAKKLRPDKVIEQVEALKLPTPLTGSQ